ncbi:MAG: phasin family protein [Gammaproteobacteria bacterium]
MQVSFEQFVAPIKEINELTMKSLEKISAIQVKTIQDSTDVSLNAIKSATEVKDLDSFNQYLQAQLVTAQGIADNAMKDAQKIVKLTEDYSAKVQSTVEKSVA